MGLICEAGTMLFVYAVRPLPVESPVVGSYIGVPKLLKLPCRCARVGTVESAE